MWLEALIDAGYHFPEISNGGKGWDPSSFVPSDLTNPTGTLHVEIPAGLRRA